MKSLDFLGYEGYAVTEDGRVYSFKTEKFLGTKSGDYRMVTLTKGSYSKPHLVHRLVAMVYLPPVEGKTIVNHKDGNKLNNHYKNLEWCTYSENAIHAIGTGLRGPVINEYRSIPESKVISVCKLLEQGVRNKDICESLSLTPSQVTMIKTGECYKDISEQFNFRKVPAKNRIAEAKVISICEDLANTDYSINQIRKKYNVSFSVVKNIKERNTYTYISNNYVW